ncbi:plasma membrane-associated cation-binding protein 1 [Elaeis guineensis]|uniref:Plasma membrane-associated cation-binding protein 1 n=1 Tax=Elaeis guineensis var. tenera TaxID=51953 RepID=A0A6I9QX59_ELAGV|nr:plasma membrane-associated cation-binding protein 1 [Elaeis guineensis]XP_010915926.1 plasma membrane-associated cation-binding protein 1 [Elaeis guineensis]XP_029119144.1 plasma membrane-associated cation-binding protein 1 [Elaeis guineensis]
MGYWKSKLLPKIKKVFDKNGKKAAAAEACKSFDDSKGEIDKEFEEKKTELQPKVVEIYEASSAEIKSVVKERTEGGVKKNSTAVTKFLEELVKIEFPGSKAASEAATKCGPTYVTGPIFFIFEKVSTFVVTEEAPAPAAEPAAPAEESSSKEEAPAASEEKKEEINKAEETTTPPPPPTEEATPAAPAEEPPKP